MSNFPPENYIEVTGISLVELVKKAYALSVPQGMGFVHFKDGDLSDDEAKTLIREDDTRCPVSLDYVRGRSVKFSVYREGDRLFIRKSWYDHSDAALQELVASVKQAA